MLGGGGEWQTSARSLCVVERDVVDAVGVAERDEDGDKDGIPNGLVTVSVTLLAILSSSEVTPVAISTFFYLSFGKRKQSNCSMIGEPCFEGKVWGKLTWTTD